MLFGLRARQFDCCGFCLVIELEPFAIEKTELENITIDSRQWRQFGINDA